MKTNILVQYSGGGYDGCIWEWNYFYIDKQETFHNIYASGCAGIDNKQDAIELIEQDKSTTFVYDLDNEQDIETFSRESHPVHVQGVLRWFEDYNSPDAEFFAVCSECGGKTYADDIITYGDRLFCHECYSIGECPACETYVGGDNIVSLGLDEYRGYSYICTDCKEDYDAEVAADELEDLRWQSFCTGSPDMFDLESAEPERNSRIEYPGQLVFEGV